jgi:hypothetical protein
MFNNTEKEGAQIACQKYKIHGDEIRTKFLRGEPSKTPTVQSLRS